MSDPQVDHTPSFRDHIATADQTGKRIWVYPARPRGRLFRARSIVAYILLALFFIFPFIKLGGQPLVVFDVLGRTFIFFGVVFRPQDIFMFVLTLLTGAVFVVLFTAVFGRLFCGWVCPQTIFMEMVFRRVERLIEGSPVKQRKLHEGPWNTTKIMKWTLKNGIFFAIAFVIGNFLLAYIIGIDRLWQIIGEPVADHVAGFVIMLLFSGVFYFVFAWFREQACTIVCPYGRLQGVLIDSNSIVVAYDYNRGEPRAKRVKGEDRADKGDCVECGSCLAVCPTGIDIRNGTQLECVNCAACIDACNAVMRKLGWKEGLIRYSSEDRLKGTSHFRLSGRVIVYSIALAVLASLLSFFLGSRTAVETSVFRTPGTMAYVSDDGTVRNLYTAKLINKTRESMNLQLRLKEPLSGSIAMVQGAVTLKPEGITEGAFFVEIPRADLAGPSTPVVIDVMHGDEVLQTVRTSFLGPEAGGGQ